MKCALCAVGPPGPTGVVGNIGAIGAIGERGPTGVVGLRGSLHFPLKTVVVDLFGPVIYGSSAHRLYRVFKNNIKNWPYNTNPFSSFKKIKNK